MSDQPTDAPDAPESSHRQRRVVVVDLPGSGESDKPDGG